MLRIYKLVIFLVVVASVIEGHLAVAVLATLFAASLNTAQVFRRRRGRAERVSAFAAPCTELRWAAGKWTLGAAGHYRAIQPSNRCVVLPRLMYFSYTQLDSQRNASLWLFGDSAPAQQQRRLRVRLRLEGLT